MTNIDLLLLLLQERYKNDINIAIQLLQCKPTHFVSQKYDNVSYISIKHILIIKLMFTLCCYSFLVNFSQKYGITCLANKGSYQTAMVM